MRPFIEQLLKLFNESKLSQIDLNFLRVSWLGKKVNDKSFHAGDQARNLGIPLSNRLGEKIYITMVPIMGLTLSSSEVVSKGMFFLCGYTRKASQQCKPYQNSMEGTRVIHTIELYENEYIIGEAFSANVRLFPEPCNLVIKRTSSSLCFVC